VTCTACHAPLLRPATPTTALLGVVLHVRHKAGTVPLCPGCGGWDEPRAKK
jgi:hypothetical protein